MNPNTVRLVQSSWAAVERIAPAAAALFYTNLFEIDPALRPLFRGDMAAQGAKLMQMIGVAVARLDQPEILLPVLANLGRRHADYGVRDEHYATVGTALLRTLEEGLGDGFTDPVRSAWTEVYGVIATTMMAASRAEA